MVVVGKTDAAVESRIADFISKIPEGEISESRAAKKFHSVKPSFFPAEREGALNYHKGFFAGPEGNAADKLAFNTAVWLFEKEYSKTLTDMGLSYDCYTWIEDGVYNHGFIAASTVHTQRVMQVTDSLIQKYRNEGFTERQLRVIPYHASNIFYLVSQTNENTAEHLGRSELFGNGWRNVPLYYQNLKKQNLPEVNTVFRKYFRNISWVYLGKLSDADSPHFLKH